MSFQVNGRIEERVLKRGNPLMVGRLRIVQKIQAVLHRKGLNEVNDLGICMDVDVV
jgi:hypothetical protein